MPSPHHQNQVYSSFDLKEDIYAEESAKLWDRKKNRRFVNKLEKSEGTPLPKRDKNYKITENVVD